MTSAPAADMLRAGRCGRHSPHAAHVWTLRTRRGRDYACPGIAHPVTARSEVTYTVECRAPGDHQWTPVSWLFPPPQPNSSHPDAAAEMEWLRLLAQTEAEGTPGYVYRLSRTTRTVTVEEVAPPVDTGAPADEAAA